MAVTLVNIDHVDQRQQNINNAISGPRCAVTEFTVYEYYSVNILRYAVSENLDLLYISLRPFYFFSKRSKIIATDKPPWRSK